MIPSTLRITLEILVVFYFILILVFLKNKTIELRYTLLWLMAGVIMVLMILFPEIFTSILHVFGIVSTMNGLFLLCIGFLLMICMALTSIVSKQTRKIKELAQELAILDNKLDAVEKQCADEGMRRGILKREHQR